MPLVQEEQTLASDKPSLDALKLGTMASGHLCLNLSERVSWEGFPAYAEALLALIAGTRVSTADSVEMRIWTVSIGHQTVRLVQEDYPMMVSLESESAEADDLLRELYEDLKIGQ